MTERERSKYFYKEDENWAYPIIEQYKGNLDMDLIIKLRAKTNCPIYMCKAALIESKFDIGEAVKILQNHSHIWA
jgi:hypothetical protein